LKLSVESTYEAPEILDDLGIVLIQDSPQPKRLIIVLDREVRCPAVADGDALDSIDLSDQFDERELESVTPDEILSFVTQINQAARQLAKRTR
jgi:hypothetical protein